MMRSKRPRSLHPANQTYGNGHSGHPRTRSMSDDFAGDDLLMHMDPSLMTERQQLAFLLRKTAQEQSGADSPMTQSSDSSDDDHQTKRPRKRIQHAKISPRTTRKTGNGHQSKAAASTPRGRPPKNAVKTTDDGPTTNKTATRVTKQSSKRLHVKTTSPKMGEAEGFSSDVASELSLTSKASIRKPSPSSTSDISHIGVFDDALGHPDFWSLHCALCSASASQLGDASCEPLFLCQSCDKKYPTQRALGRV